MTTIIQTGTKYDLYDSSIQTHQSLPAGIYKVTFNPQSGHQLLYVADKNDIKEKIYGVHTKKVEKVLNTFRNFNRSEGVLLSGDKGIGKSLFTKLLTNAVIDMGLPVIYVNEASSNLGDYIDSIPTECMILFDEFDKTFSSPYEQNDLLSLFDGTSRNKKLFVITCNNLDSLSSFLVNRPGRFHYHICFKYPTSEDIVKYLKDKLDEKYWGEIPKVVKRATAIKTNYDTLRAIAYELQQGWSFEEAIEDLNIDKGNKTIYFNICYTQKNKECHSLKVPFVPSKVEAEKVKLSLTDKLGCIIGEAIFSTDDFYFDINDNDFKLNVEKATYQFNTVRRGIYKPQDGEEIVTDKDKENAVITEIVITNISEDF